MTVSLPDQIATGIEGIDEQHIFRLSNFKDKKPVLLILSGPCDSFSWHGKLTAYINYFYQMYGEQMDENVNR